MDAIIERDKTKIAVVFVARSPRLAIELAKSAGKHRIRESRERSRTIAILSFSRKRNVEIEAQCFYAAARRRSLKKQRARISRISSVTSLSLGGSLSS